MARLPAMNVRGNPTEEETGKVLSWRTQSLVRAGFPESVAYLLADNKEVDVHRAIRLLEDGCPAELVAKIEPGYPENTERPVKGLYRSGRSLSRPQPQRGGSSVE